MTNASSNRAAMMVLAYLWPLALVPFLVEKNDGDVQWHARHGIVLMGAELLLLLALSMATAAVSLATTLVAPAVVGLGCIIGLFYALIWIGIVALHAAAILRALSGSRLIVPAVSEYADRF